LCGWSEAAEGLLAGASLTEWISRSTSVSHPPTRNDLLWVRQVVPQPGAKRPGREGRAGLRRDHFRHRPIRARLPGRPDEAPPRSQLGAAMARGGPGQWRELV